MTITNEIGVKILIHACKDCSALLPFIMYIEMYDHCKLFLYSQKLDSGEMLPTVVLHVCNNIHYILLCIQLCIICIHITGCGGRTETELWDGMIGLLFGVLETLSGIMCGILAVKLL